MNAESARSMAWELANHRDQLSPDLRERLEWGLAHKPIALDAARATLSRARAAFADTVAQVDVLLTPSAPGEAPAGLSWTGDPAFNSIWTALHVPCVTVPVATGRLGLPLGLQVVGPMGADALVLAAAQWVRLSLG